MKKQSIRTLKLSRESLRTIAGWQLARAAGGLQPDPTTAATDGNTGCQSEAGGCHTGLSGCGTC
jgi:hypothetical protein